METVEVSRVFIARGENAEAAALAAVQLYAIARAEQGLRQSFFLRLRKDYG